MFLSGMNSAEVSPASQETDMHNEINNNYERQQ